MPDDIEQQEGSGDANGITEADFVAARNVAYGCLSAVEGLLLACSDIATMLLNEVDFFPEKLPLSPEAEFLKLTHAIKSLCDVLDSTGVEAQAASLEWTDWDDSQSPDKIRKVKHRLLPVTTVPTWQGCNTAHEQAFCWALQRWFEIKNLLVRKSQCKEESYEAGPGFALDAGLIEEHCADIYMRIDSWDDAGSNYREAKAYVEKEWAKALEAWKAETGLESAQRKPEAVENQYDGSLFDRVIDILTSQGCEIVKCLWDFKHSTSYDRLASTPKLWRDPKPRDETIQKALKRVANKLNEHPDLGVTIEISHSKRRVRLIRPPDKSGDK